MGLLDVTYYNAGIMTENDLPFVIGCHIYLSNCLMDFVYSFTELYDRCNPTQFSPPFVLEENLCNNLHI